MVRMRGTPIPTSSSLVRYHGPHDENTVNAALQRAASALFASDAVLVAVGAGMGVDSGIPDFRGTESLFAGFEQPMSYEQMSNSEHFQRDPAFAWGVNYVQLELYRRAQPHDGFARILSWMQALGKPWFAFTSNIDGQLQKAGFPDRQVIACHGDLRYLQCTEAACAYGPRSAGGAPAVWRHSLPPGLEVEQSSLRLASPELLQERTMRCPRCGSLARPNVWFCHDRGFVVGEHAREKASRFESWLLSLRHAKRNVAVLEIGAGLAIPTVRKKTEEVVAACGQSSCLIRINPKDYTTPFTTMSKAVSLPMGAQEALARIDSALASLVGTVQKSQPP